MASPPSISTNYPKSSTALSSKTSLASDVVCKSGCASRASPPWNNCAMPRGIDCTASGNRSKATACGMRCGASRCRGQKPPPAKLSATHTCCRHGSAANKAPTPPCTRCCKKPAADYEPWSISRGTSTCRSNSASTFVGKPKRNISPLKTVPRSANS